MILLYFFPAIGAENCVPSHISFNVLPSIAIVN
jgi:hypothetical protein